MYRLFFATLLLSLTVLTAEAADKFRYRGYSGGMLLHTGYIQSAPFDLLLEGDPIETLRIRGGAFGIGGAMKFSFGTKTDQFRFGFEGHSSNIAYRPRPSYSHTGWGGVCFDYLRNTKGRVHPFFGFLIGGGGTKNHIQLEGSVEDFETDERAAYHKYGMLAIAPSVGMEISLTKKIRLMIKLDYLFNALESQPDFSSGIRIYVGMLFNRLKD